MSTVSRSALSSVVFLFLFGELCFTPVIAFAAAECPFAAVGTTVPKLLRESFREIADAYCGPSTQPAPTQSSPVVPPSVDAVRLAGAHMMFQLADPRSATVKQVAEQGGEVRFLIQLTGDEDRTVVMLPAFEE